MCVGCVNLCANDEYNISETYVYKHIHVPVYTIIHMYGIYVRILFVRVCGCVSDVLICVWIMNTTYLENIYIHIHTYTYTYNYTYMRFV